MERSSVAVVSNLRIALIPVQEIVPLFGDGVHVLGAVGGVELQACAIIAIRFTVEGQDMVQPVVTVFVCFTFGCLQIGRLNVLPAPRFRLFELLVFDRVCALHRIAPGEHKLDGGEGLAAFGQVQVIGQSQMLPHVELVLGAVVGVGHQVGVGLVGSGSKEVFQVGLGFLVDQIIIPLDFILPQLVDVQFSALVVAGETSRGIYNSIGVYIVVVFQVLERKAVRPVHVFVGPLADGQGGDFFLNKRFHIAIHHILVQRKGHRGQVLVGEAAGGVLPQLPPLDGHGVADAVGDLAAFQKGVIGVAVNVALLNFLLDRFVVLHGQN